MKDIWMVIGILLLIFILIGVVGTVCIFFSKVWEHINAPKDKPQDVYAFPTQRLIIDGVQTTNEDYGIIMKLLSNTCKTTIMNCNFTKKEPITLEELGKHIRFEKED